MAAAYFADSSALVKRYVQETGTSWVRRLTRRSPSTVIYIARITAVEVPCAIARRRKGKTLTPRRASAILHRFRQHLAGFKVPKAVVLAEALPKNPSGKILKRTLRSQLAHLYTSTATKAGLD